MKLELVK